jgi:hypothetical protein
MLDISRWINNIRSVSISRSNSKIYQTLRNYLMIYNLKNISNVYDAVKILKQLASDGYNSSDKIMERICYLFSRDLPTEIYLAKLSLLYQSVIGTHRIEEFAILIIWTCAIQSIMEDENKKICKVKIEIIVENAIELKVRVSILTGLY